MSENILTKERVSFKEIEKRIYEAHCKMAREDTAKVLRLLDDELHASRDKAIYRDKGIRKTTIKTVYGEVEYSRRVYITKTQEGKNAAVYLLDEELGMDKIGLISTPSMILLR